MIGAIKEALRELGIVGAYKGYRRASVAILLVLENEDRLLSVVRDIYGQVGGEGCSWMAVERSIRTVVERAWRCNRAKLEEMAQYPLKAPPSASEFIEMVAHYVKREKL